MYNFGSQIVFIYYNFSELHGQNPVVTSCNTQNLNHFELQSRKLNPGLAGNAHMSNQSQGTRNYTGPQGTGLRPPLINRSNRPNGPLIGGQPRLPMPPQGNGGSYQGQTPWHPMGLGGGPSRGQPPVHSGPSRPGMQMMRMPNQRGPNPQSLLRAPGIPDIRSQHPQQIKEWSEHGAHSGHPSQTNSMSLVQGHGQPNSSMSQRSSKLNCNFKSIFLTIKFNLFENFLDRPSQVPNMPPVGGPHSGPAPHVNPAFFQPQHQGVPQSQTSDPYRVPQGLIQYADYMASMGGDSSLLTQMTEAEFEEIMQKNRSVSSSAISRAVADASAGKF